MTKNTDPLITIDRFNQGGLAFSKWSGLENSLYKLTGFDPHSLPGILLTEQKMTKDSGTTVTELCRERVNCSNGIQYWFSYESGKIWQNKNGTYTLVYTTSAAAGANICLGAYEYQGYIYYATESRLHRIAVANADGAAAWSANIALNWATFVNTDALFHPMAEVNLVLYIGDGRDIAQVDAGTFSNSALDIATPLRAKCLGKFGTNLLIGTFVADTVTKTQIINWNTWSNSFTSSDDIPEVGINAFLQADNMILVSCGTKGNIYSYNGSQLELWGKIPGEYSATATGEVYPSSVANKEGQILIGFSNITGNPADQGIYRIGRHSNSYDYIIDFPYPTSERSGSEFVTTGVNIGGIMVVGSDIYMSVKSGGTAWIDKLDSSNKLSGAYFETRVTTIEREKETNFVKSIVAYADLPANTDIDMYLSKNYAAYGSALSKVTDTDRLIVETKDEATNFITLQMKVKVTTSGNTAAKIESAGIFI
jgi:hypothetical protein